MIHVVAILTAKPGKRTELLEAFLKVVPLVHAEKGCIEYQAVTDAVDAGKIQTPLGADSYMVVEKWETVGDLNTHSVAEHMIEFGQSNDHLIDSRTIHVLS